MRDAAVSKTADIGSEDQRPRETAARGPRVAPWVPRVAGRRRRVARSRLAGKASSRWAPREDRAARRSPAVGGSAPGVWSRVQIRKGLPPVPGAGPGPVPSKQSHPCRTRPACPGGLHIAKANVRHLKRQSPLKVLQVCTAGRRASNTCGPNRQTHVAGGDSTPFSHGPQCG